MKRPFASEQLFVEELTQAAKRAQMASKGLPLGALIKIIRNQIGMSQKILSQRARVPQSTISRIEKGEKNTNVSTIQKILKALSCDFVMIPLLLESIEEIRRRQARKQAEIHVRYLKGTMSLEQQEPDPQFLEKLIKQEEDRLLRKPGSALWENKRPHAL